MLKQGVRIALLAHCAGVALAAVPAWFLPVFCVKFGLVSAPGALRGALFVALALWGGWAALRIVKGKDPKANKLIEHFGKGEPDRKAKL